MSELRKSGIEVLGEIPWGAYFCNFYETKQDLLEILVPYFKAGLQNNEFCLWILPTRIITAAEAKAALKKAVPELDRLIAERHIEILDQPGFYMEGNAFRLKHILREWNEKLKGALASGFDGMRVSGDMFWLSESNWEEFYAYEKKLSYSIHAIPIIVLNTYPLAKTGAADIFDIIHAHQFALARRKGEWEVVETAIQMQAQDEIKRLNKELSHIRLPVPKPTFALKYAAAVLSVTVATLIALYLDVYLVTAPVSLLFCSLIFSTWHGGKRPGLLAVALSVSAFKYFFITPRYSFVIDISQVPRLIVFTVPAVAIVLFIAAQKNMVRSLIKTRNILKGTLLKLKKTNKVLQEEINERKQAQKTLNVKDREFRGIVENTPDHITRFDREFRSVYVNPAVIRTYGLKARELVGKPAQAVFDGLALDVTKDEVLQLHEWITAVFNTGESSEHEMSWPAPIARRHFSVGFFPEYNSDGSVAHVLTVARDITERKKAEDALRESELRYLSLFENMAEGVSYLEAVYEDNTMVDAIYLEVNPAWKGMTGASNVAGRKISEVFPGILDVDHEFFEFLRQVVLTHQPNRFEAYSTFVNKWISLAAYCPREGHVISVMDNITERKLAEKTLQQSYQEIRRLTEHLQKVREEERVHIAREIHDELGQQLTAIKMDVAWIDKNTPKETADVKTKLKNIIELLDGSNQSVRRILSELRPRILDEESLLDAIEWLGRQFSEKTGIPVTFTTTEKEVKVSEQIATCIFRVCQEAFTNIIRYSKAKNITDSIMIAEGEIIFSIEDDGIGFDVIAAQNKKSFGILGMRERVFSMGGKFELDSSPGKGTKITVTLPYGETKDISH
jgi:PAS domain S-box-containing protein